jgi:NAD-dependent SIR2 family protein deacetylase
MASIRDHEARMSDALKRAAEAIAAADALLVTAGAGMGVDSGLPDFRGDAGFWKAYPPFERAGLRFVDLANPSSFADDPAVGWGFYGHRQNLYRRTVPHAGFDLLKQWGEAKPGGTFVFTSNVDGQFQRAGFPADGVCEVHGSILHRQCLQPCGSHIWEADAADIVVDESTFRADPPLPTCPRCGGLARPNVLMFGDYDWVSDRTDAQERRLSDWLRSVSGRRVAIVECGAGTGVPTVRMFGERVSARPGVTLIRINVREPEVPAGHIGIPSGALSALSAIDELIKG